jgi:hypothetical protein
MRRILLFVFLFAISPVVLAQKANDQNKNQQPETPPSVNITPASLEFGDQVVKRASKPKRITVTNTGGKALYINSVVLGGDNQQDFTLSQDTCTGASVGVQKSCVIDIVFTPSANDKRKATLTLTDNAPNSPQNMQLSGDGINSANVPPSRVRRRR